MPRRGDKRKISMYAIGISGSPRRRGNSEILLDKALDGSRSRGASAEKIVLNELDFKPCQECGGCRDTGICIIDDDMRPLYEKIASADAIIVASPIFFGTISAQLKAMIDRFNCAWMAKCVLKKPSLSRRKAKGAFLCVAGSDKREFFESAKKTIKIFFATVGIEYSKELFVGGLEDKGEVAENGKAMEEAYNIGKEIWDAAA